MTEEKVVQEPVLVMNEPVPQMNDAEYARYIKTHSEGLMHISAYDFASHRTYGWKDKASNTYKFGVDQATIAARLRSIADKCESGDILPQRVEVISTADNEKWTSTIIIFEFVEKEKV